MLHIVQVVFVGKAEKPQIFFDPAGAEVAYVKQVKKHWRRSYPIFCDDQGVETGSFASAKAFLETLDLAEKSQVNYWIVKPDDAALDKVKHLEWIEQRRERIDRLLGEVKQTSAKVKDGLSELLDDLTQLTECFSASENPPAEVQAGEAEDESVPSIPVAKEPEEDAENYTTKDWKAFVGSIMNLCGGSRGECSLLARPDWRKEVYDSATSLEYWDWVAAKMKKFREKAEEAGYTVIEDSESPGHYRVRTPEGTVEETSFYSEWEAWCQAGMNLS